MPAPLKEIAYGKRMPYARAVYLCDGDRIFFSGLEGHPSTINAAEQVVLAICKAEGLEWQNCTFYDIQTRSGYPTHEIGWYAVDRLILVDTNGSPHVDAWQPVDYHAWPKAKNPDVSKEVLDTFNHLINS